MQYVPVNRYPLLLNGDEHCQSCQFPMQTRSAADLTGTQVLTVKSLKHAARHFIYTILSLISFYYRTRPGSASGGGCFSYIATNSVQQDRQQCNKVLNSTIITYFDFVSKSYHISCTVC